MGAPGHLVDALTRAFVAVPCGEPLAGELSRRLDALPGPAPVRWTHPATWHLTLQFLGDWPADRLAALQMSLSRLDGPAPFRLAPAGLGGFPNLRRPRVLFLQFAGADRCGNWRPKCTGTRRGRGRTGRRTPGPSTPT